MLAHLAGCAWIARADNVVLLGPPGVGKPHLALGLGLKAVQAGHAVLFDTAIGWITRLRDAHDTGRLAAELERLRRYRLLMIDEAGYIWGEVCGDDMAAAVMIDRLVHHAEVITLTGDSYRTRARRELPARDPAAATRTTLPTTSQTD
jgi:DNA replication protein DnaC